MTDQPTPSEETEEEEADRLRVGGWVPSRNDSTATQLVPAVPPRLEVPDFLQPRVIGPLMPERADRRRGRWWFLAVPVVIALLMVAVVLQFGSDEDPVRPAAPDLSPVVALPSSAPPPPGESADPSVSVSASASASASRRSAAPARSNRTSSTPAAPPAHRGAIVGINGRCLAVDRNGPELAVCEDRSSQRWTAGSDGTIRIMSRWCLDVSGSGEANGTPVILYPCNRTDAQQWQRRGDGTWRNPQSNRCLSTVGGRSDPGTRLVISDCAGGRHQRWTLT